MPTAALPADGSRRRPRDRKAQILIAARDLFVERGYPSVTMVLIAEQVGITAGALYRHFGNKADLLEEVIRDNFGWLDEPLAAVTFDGMVAELLDRFRDRPYLSDLWTHEVRFLPEEERAELRRRMRAWNLSLAPAIRERRGPMAPGQEELLTWAVQSLTSSLGRRAIGAPPAAKIEAIRAALGALAEVELTTAESRPRADGGERLLPNSTRERLLMAATNLFGERGFEDASMTAIAAAAQVTGPNLYFYFDSKSAVLQAVLERGVHALWLGLDDALATSTRPTEALAKLARSYVGLARTWASVLERPGAIGDTEAAQREYVAEWVALLQQARPRLDAKSARIRVQLALLVVADLHRVPHLAREETFVANLTGLVLAVLFAGASEPGGR